MAGDAVYDDVHLYLAESPAAGRDAWRAALDVVAGLAPRAASSPVTSGPAAASTPPRSTPPGRYLDDFEELLADAAGPLELYRSMRARHPDRVNPGALWGSARAALPAETSLMIIDTSEPRRHGGLQAAHRHASSRAPSAG